MAPAGELEEQRSAAGPRLGSAHWTQPCLSSVAPRTRAVACGRIGRLKVAPKVIVQEFTAGPRAHASCSPRHERPREVCRE
jgi:hypothetical protein